MQQIFHTKTRSDARSNFAKGSIFVVEIYCSGEVHRVSVSCSSKAFGYAHPTRGCHSHFVRRKYFRRGLALIPHTRVDRRADTTRRDAWEGDGMAGYSVDTTDLPHAHVTRRSPHTLRLRIDTLPGTLNRLSLRSSSTLDRSWQRASEIFRGLDNLLGYLE